MTPRENIPSFETYVSIPKTKTALNDCIRRNEIFVALVANNPNNLFSTSPILVFYFEKNMYRDNFLGSNDIHDVDSGYVTIHGIDFSPEMKPYFISAVLDPDKIIYPLPDSMLEMLFECTWSNSKTDLDGDVLTPFARKALQLRREVIANTQVPD